MTMYPIIKVCSSYHYSLIITLVIKGFHIFFKLVYYNIKEIVKHTLPVSVFAQILMDAYYLVYSVSCDDAFGCTVYFNSLSVYRKRTKIKKN